MKIYRENVTRLDPERKLEDFAVPTLAIGDKWMDKGGTLHEIGDFSIRKCSEGDIICYKFLDKAEYPCWSLDKFLLEGDKPPKILRMEVEEFMDAEFEVIGFTKKDIVLLSKEHQKTIVLNMKDIQGLLTKMICQYGDSEATETLEDNLKN